MQRFHRRSRVSNAEMTKLHATSMEISRTTAAEWCYYVELSSPLTKDEITSLNWLLRETFDPWGMRDETFLEDYRSHIEIGPRLDFETPWGGTARQICQTVGLEKVERIERSRRFGFTENLSTQQRELLIESVCDRMTQMSYDTPPESFKILTPPTAVRVVPLLKNGLEELKKANLKFGLAMEPDDLTGYLKLFVETLKRDPTDVELFSLGQGNSEHCRHGYFRGNLVLDGRPLNTSLMKIVKSPWIANPNNSIIAFHDDSSAIEGQRIKVLVPKVPGYPSELRVEDRTYHPTLTAETHNFPTGIAPYPGGATGTGGRIRDNQAVGRGGIVVASGAGYSVANLHIPDYSLPWEQDGMTHPENLAAPLDILISASNGASDYGNCFGEPLILGHARTFGQDTPDGYRAWFKPIMYSEGVGMLDARHAEKGKPETGMLIVQVGGPAYRIGLGGGAASSLLSGDNSADLDFNAVQRGDAEMEQRLNRVIRTCVELGEDNPIVSAHDLGAGGDSNALPEIIDPIGGRIDLRAIPVADSSLSVLEIWGNESQERDALLLRPEDLARFEAICAREGAPVAVVGTVTDTGRLVLYDSVEDSTPVDLPLEPILGDIPPKTIHIKKVAPKLKPLDLPSKLTVREALERVLRLVSVGSKSWLTRKVDRSVTGLVAQQQGVGPLETPLSDFAMVAHSLFGFTGTVLSQGERPILGLISPGAQGRMSVAEAITNMMGARIANLGDIRASANWMWPAKLDGEGAKLYEAAQAMSETMTALGMAVDGGKDSLSMAAQSPKGLIKAPGQLVVAPYAFTDDIRQKVTPDLKNPGNRLLLIDLSGGFTRLGGSSLAQAFSQVGNSAPDLEDVELLARVFDKVQVLSARGLIKAMHDRSDGGLIVTALEMAMAGNLGLKLEISSTTDPISSLFNEEVGLIIEIDEADVDKVLSELEKARIPSASIGRVGQVAGHIQIVAGDTVLLEAKLHEMRGIWEETSSRLDAKQANPECVNQEFELMKSPRVVPNWRLSFAPAVTTPPKNATKKPPRVAVIREVGNNSDREMAAAFVAAGFEAWDVTTSDLAAGRISLEQFRGVVFPGGFSFGDVLDSGKGAAAMIKFNPKLARGFAEFYSRSDTFSLGVCNGAQLMAFLGWAPFAELPDEQKPRFISNISGRFESRFTTVEIMPSPAIMFAGMEGSRLGVWVAHGEGRVHVPGDDVMKEISKQKLAPLRFVEPEGGPTQEYPFNPNGSPEGITGLCSPDGRHLAIMPHPERSSNGLWQWPWLPQEWSELEASPWLRMFQNAYKWCERN